MAVIKKTFRVADMHCANCAMRIEGIEDDLPGIRSVRASYRKQRVEMEYDEGVVGASEIMAAMERLGYTATEESKPLP